MQAMSHWYLLNVFVSGVYQHLSTMREGILLLYDRGNIVLNVHTRHLPTVHRG